MTADVAACSEHQRLERLEVEMLGVRSDLVQSRVLMGELQAQLLRMQTALATVPGLQLQLEPLLSEEAYKLDSKAAGLARLRSETRASKVALKGSAIESPVSEDTLQRLGLPGQDSDDAGGYWSCASMVSPPIRSSSVASAESSEQAGSLCATEPNSAATGPRRKAMGRLGSFVVREAASLVDPAVDQLSSTSFAKSWQPEAVEVVAVATSEEPLGPRLTSTSSDHGSAAPQPLNAAIDVLTVSDCQAVSRGTSPPPRGPVPAMTPERPVHLAALSPSVDRFQRRAVVSEGLPFGRQALTCAGQPPPPLMKACPSPTLPSSDAMSVLSSSLPTWSFSSAPQRRSSSERRTEPQASLAGSPLALRRGESPQAHILSRHTPVRATIGGGEVSLSYSYAPLGHVHDQVGSPSAVRVHSPDQRCVQAPLLRTHVGSVAASSLAPTPLVRRSVTSGATAQAPVTLPRGRAVSSSRPPEASVIPVLAERKRSISPTENGSVQHAYVRHAMPHSQIADADKIDESLRE
mmetsp:Transcript_14365/g.26416  ORF Transcript_14365/g.26416 Transcript_14365/m.26416 type:complete len:521 (-) Transcript_14365:107-1669(-)